MKPPDIEKALEHESTPAPPSDLADRIKAEIPERLETSPALSESATRQGRPRDPRWLAAAAALLLGLGAVAWQLRPEPLPVADRQGADGATPSDAEPPIPAPAPFPPAPEARPAPVEPGPPVTEPPPRTAAAPTPAPTPPPGSPQGPAPAPPMPARTVFAGALRGSVADQTGAVVPGATVEITETGSRTTRTTVTDAQGEFLFPTLPPTTYAMEVELAGFKTLTLDTLPVLAGQRTTVASIVLEVGALTETLAVTAGPAVSFTESRSVERVSPAPPPQPTVAYDLAVAAVEVPSAVEGGVPGGVVGGVVGGTAAAPSAGLDPGASTGGSAEPNDQPYGDVFFREYGVNPFIDTEDDRLSTFGLDVDTGSFTIVRRFLRDGNRPPREAIRVEELVNYFDYGDPPPERGDFALHAEGAPAIFAEGERYQILRFGIAARSVDRDARPPAVLTFVVDVSGSMSREDRLGLVQRSLRALLDNLRSDDRVGLVVYGSRGQVLLEPTTDHGAIRAAIDRLSAGGSTNAEEGLVLGYELAARYRGEERINRVILCSDGVANVGATGPESILARIQGWAAQGIELTTVGFGMGNYNDVLMERLADTGDGRYAYVDSFAEARRIFVEELTGTLLTLGRDAKAQVEFDPKVVSRYRLLGYENRDIADERFRDPTVDAGEIGAGHRVTALYEVKLQEKVSRRATAATLRLRYRPAGRDEPVELEKKLRVADLAPSWERARPGLRLAGLVGEFAEILKRSYWARSGSFAEVLRRARPLAAHFPGDARVADLLAMLAEAERLERAESPPAGIGGPAVDATAAPPACIDLVPVLDGGPAAAAVGASGAQGREHAGWRAFDGDPTTSWISETGPAPSWLEYAFAFPQVVTRYGIVYGARHGRAPRDWELRGWSGEHWVVLDSRSGETGWSGSERRSYSVPSPGPHLRYRLHVTRAENGRAPIPAVSIGDLALEVCTPGGGAR